MLEKDSLLIYLAEKGANTKQIELSTIQISKDIGSSQQTISRKLVELEEQNWIERIASTRGIKLKITEKGLEHLKDIHLKLHSIFNHKVRSISGTVESGLGEGAYYVSLKQYMNQFIKKLNINPYKGTLNVKVVYTDYIQFITSQNKIIIDGFKAENRTFGPIVAYKIKVNGIDSAILIPERTSHNRDVIEIISDINFRQKLKLKDGQVVKITS